MDSGLSEAVRLKRAIMDTPLFPDMWDQYPVEDVIVNLQSRYAQLDDLLEFQNALIQAADPPNDLTPDQLIPWFVARLKQH
jgi:hypothetical protein